MKVGKKRGLTEIVHEPEEKKVLERSLTVLPLDLVHSFHCCHRWCLFLGGGGIHFIWVNWVVDPFFERLDAVTLNLSIDKEGVGGWYTVSLWVPTLIGGVEILSPCWAVENSEWIGCSCSDWKRAAVGGSFCSFFCWFNCRYVILDFLRVVIQLPLNLRCNGWEDVSLMLS